MKLLGEAGLEMVSRHGFDGASTKMVAEHARINEALISRSFGGKDGLLDAIIGEFARGLYDDAAAYAAGRTVEEELANFLTGTIGAATRNATFLKLVLTRALLYPEFRTTITRELQGAGEARLLERLRLFQARQAIRSTTDLQGTIEVLRLFIAGTVLHQLALSSPGGVTKRTIASISKAVASTLTSNQEGPVSSVMGHHTGPRAHER